MCSAVPASYFYTFKNADFLQFPFTIVLALTASWDNFFLKKKSFFVFGNPVNRATEEI